MMAGSHVAIGVAAWVLAAPHLGLPAAAPASVAPAALVLAAGGALAPDLDHPGSWLGRRLRVASVPISALLGHRGVTHSLLALALLILGLCTLAPRPQGIGRATLPPFAIGYASHLLADMLTPAGLPLLWPWRRRFALPLCRTGSAAEYLLVGAVIAWLGVRSEGLYRANVTRGCASTAACGRPSR